MSRLKEDVTYGIYDRPGPDLDEKFIEDEPITVQPQMSVQLSTDMPPVEDDQYAPTTTSALSSSAAEIAKSVPPDQIGFFYKGLHRLLDAATDRTSNLPEEEEPMKESLLKNKIQRMLLEIISDEDVRDFEEFRYGKPEPDPESAPSAGSDQESLDDLAKEFGFSGPSGIRQFITRTLGRVSFAAANLDGDKLDALNSVAVPEYIAAMKGGGYIDDNDAADLQAAPKIVEGLPSFRYFFVSGFILPVYKQINRERNREVKSQIESLGLPRDLHDTVFNQATGRAEEGPRTIRNKLSKNVQSGQLSQDEADQMEAQISSLVKSFKKPSEKGENFVELALSKWQSLGKAKKQRILEKALQDTIDDSGV